MKNWWQRWKQFQKKHNTWIYRWYQRHRYARIETDFNLPTPIEQDLFWSASRFQCRDLIYYLKKYGNGVKPFNRAVYCEIGVGESFQSLVGLSLAKMKKIVGIDVCRLLNRDKLKNTIAFYQKYYQTFNLKKPQSYLLPVLENQTTNIDQFLLNNFRINYQAPGNACQMNFADNSVDYIGSMCVFEHIPKNELQQIITECFRILKFSGVFFIYIDYQDHIMFPLREDGYPGYVSEKKYDFLRFSESEWKQCWKEYLGRLSKSTSYT